MDSKYCIKNLEGFRFRTILSTLTKILKSKFGALMNHHQTHLSSRSKANTSFYVPFFNSLSDTKLNQILESNSTKVSFGTKT